MFPLHKHRVSYFLLKNRHRSSDIKTSFSAFSAANCSSSLSLSLCLHHSGGGGRVGNDAGTDTWPLCGGGLPAQPWPAGGHLSHHAHWSTQAGRLSPTRHHAVPAAFPGEAGEEAAGHQDRGGWEGVGNVCSVSEVGHVIRWELDGGFRTSSAVRDASPYAKSWPPLPPNYTTWHYVVTWDNVTVLMSS